MSRNTYKRVAILFILQFSTRIFSRKHNNGYHRNRYAWENLISFYQLFEAVGGLRVKLGYTREIIEENKQTRMRGLNINMLKEEVDWRYILLRLKNSNFPSEIRRDKILYM